MELNFIDVLLLGLVGLIGGGLGGLLGIGGSIIFIPLMDQIFHGRLSAQGGAYNLWAATALLSNVFVGGGAAVSHWRNRRILPRAVKMIVPLGIAGAIVGVAVRVQLPPEALWVVFGVVAIYMAIRNLQRLWKRQETKAIDSDRSCDLPKLTWLRMTPVASITGFLSGILGIGGGVFSVPAQQLFIDIPQKNAIANSAATMPVFCAIAAIMSLAALPEELSWVTAITLAGVLVPSALIGAFVGGHLTHRAPDVPIRMAFVALLLWTAYKGLLLKTGLI